MNGAAPSSNPGGSTGPSGTGGNPTPGGGPSNNNNNHTPLSQEGIWKRKNERSNMQVRGIRLFNQIRNGATGPKLEEYKTKLMELTRAYKSHEAAMTRDGILYARYDNGTYNGWTVMGENLIAARTRIIMNINNITNP